MSEHWLGALQQLLDGGAELAVTDPDGETVFTAPLARTWRLDPDDADCLWLRPIAAPLTGDDGTTIFALSQCRRRSLTITTAPAVTGDGLIFTLATGQHAVIRAATGRATETLDAWDTFVGTRLTAEEETALDALEDDSWSGRYA